MKTRTKKLRLEDIQAVPPFSNFMEMAPMLTELKRRYLVRSARLLQSQTVIAERLGVSARTVKRRLMPDR